MSFYASCGWTFYALARIRKSGGSLVVGCDSGGGAGSGSGLGGSGGSGDSGGGSEA